jgi:serine/threonine-protein kinase HipA
MSNAKINIFGKTFGYISWNEEFSTSVFELDENFNLDIFNPAPFIIKPQIRKYLGNDFDEIYNGLFPPFIDSLPDSFGNKVFTAWMNEKGLEKKDFNPVERLLYIGNRGMGAFEYEKGKELGRSSDINLNEIATLANEIVKGKVNLSKKEIKNLEGIVNFGGASIGGAQAKILLGEQGNRFVPGDIEYDKPTDYYVLKLTNNDGTDWSTNKNKIEFVYNELARKAGINVAHSKLIELDGMHHFASKRFDRINGEKLHAQTFFALSGKFTRSQRFDYKHLFKLLDYFKSDAATKQSLYKQMVFNILSGNTDTHYKNFGFLMNKHGQWNLSPAYDLTFPNDPFQSTLSLHFAEVNGKRTEITRDDFLAVAKDVGILKPIPLIEEVENSLSTFWQEAKAADIDSSVKIKINAIIKNNIKLSNT